MKILITGGAGFVGSNLARMFKSDGHEVCCFDNLRRRGSEINVGDFKRRGIKFVHGDVRHLSDLMDMQQTFDLVIEASAEPSVLAGLEGSPDYLIQTNLFGAYNCLEFVRAKGGGIIFLSTSRVYSLDALNEINLDETTSRFELSASQSLPGISGSGINEHFPVNTARSLYGATKLSAELFVQEYANAFNIKAIINRCGVIAGPGQFGKVDQGVFTLWVAHHYFRKPLKYTGFGGTGKQVRDLLHPEDLYTLISTQAPKIDAFGGDVFCVGGSRACSTSMKEFTNICSENLGFDTVIKSDDATSSVDIPLYLTDYFKAKERFQWTPQHTAETIVRDIVKWIKENEDVLHPIFN